MTIRLINPLPEYRDVLERITNEDVVSRIWSHDYTVWDSSPEEIANRLGWLKLPCTMTSQVPRIATFAASICAEGFTHAALLGMGGSSLAPDMLSRVFGSQCGFLPLQILDTTHPQTVRQLAEDLAEEKSLFIVATKSGTTSETLALFRFFYQRVAHALGSDEAGSRFIAITDPGTPLVKLASQHAFREVFLNDPDLGGRYSALSLFGLVPAALLGLDVDALLYEAQSVASQCAPAMPIAKNPASQLGLFLGTCALAGLDKATLLLSKKISPLGDWIEQLLAESTGKGGKGIVPIIETLPERTKSWSHDRVFVAIRLGEDSEQDAIVDALAEQGRPVMQISLDAVSEVAGQFYLWEFATAIACHILGVHPFNQPDVESAKQLARTMAEESRQTGQRPQLESKTLSVSDMRAFLIDVRPSDYVGIHAYLPPTQDLTDALHVLQAAIRDHYGVAVTVGYGPRFLHSTGQLHKGDRGNGRFLQLVSASMPLVDIPDSPDSQTSSLGFGALIIAQAAGDCAALENSCRPVVTFRVAADASESIRDIAMALGS
ncbi:glucose-6-phosphate isomerase [Candidatus Bipolaricaulota bacterium]|nr:glucose-6-phosphate isomerase [Candidatus Bipolaricaulota bacterium]